jgi:succinate-semialdehyde dehydrogenase/glutarate-semialdehyde dehydrogenase
VAAWRDEIAMARVLTQRGAFIGGEWLSGEGDEIEVRSPATGETLGSVRAATSAQVDAAVTAAAAAFETWRRTSVLERVEICRRGYDVCMERAEEIARMITRETGKTIRESREEMVEYTADHFRRAAEDVLRHAGQVLPSTQGRTHKRIIVIQEPVGVVAAISPWNFPVDIGASRSSTAWPSAARRSGSRPSSRRCAPSCSSTSCTRPGSPPAPSTSCMAAAMSARR